MLKDVTITSVLICLHCIFLAVRLMPVYTPQCTPRGRLRYNMISKVTIAIQGFPQYKSTAIKVSLYHQHQNIVIIFQPHQKHFEKVEWCCTVLPLFRENPGLFLWWKIFMDQLYFCMEICGPKDIYSIVCNTE